MIEIDMLADWGGKNCAPGEVSPGRTALDLILYNGSKVVNVHEDGWYAHSDGAERIEEGAMVFLSPFAVPVRGGIVRVYEELIVAVPLTDPEWTIRKVVQDVEGITALLLHPEHEERAVVLESSGSDVATTQDVRRALADAGVYSGTPGGESAWHGHVLIDLLLAQYGEQ